MAPPALSPSLSLLLSKGRHRPLPSPAREGRGAPVRSAPAASAPPGTAFQRRFASAGPVPRMVSDTAPFTLEGLAGGGCISLHPIQACSKPSGKKHKRVILVGPCGARSCTLHMGQGVTTASSSLLYRAGSSPEGQGDRPEEVRSQGLHPRADGAGKGPQSEQSSSRGQGRLQSRPGLGLPARGGSPMTALHPSLRHRAPELPPR